MILTSKFLLLHFIAHCLLLFLILILLFLILQLISHCLLLFLIKLLYFDEVIVNNAELSGHLHRADDVTVDVVDVDTAGDAPVVQ